MSKYRVIVSKHIAERLLEYVAFISNVSTEAARQFIYKYETIVIRLVFDGVRPHQINNAESWETTVFYHF